MEMSSSNRLPPLNIDHSKLISVPTALKDFSSTLEPQSSNANHYNFLF